MNISNYQMHNVLKVYTRQFSRNKISEQQMATTGRTSAYSINISADARRLAVRDQVAEDIVARITSNGPQNEFDREIVDRLKDEIDGKNALNQKRNSEFVYNVINGEREKTTNRLSVKDSSFLIRRLEQLAKEAANKNMAMQLGQPEK